MNTLMASFFCCNSMSLALYTVGSSFAADRPCRTRIIRLGVIVTSLPAYFLDHIPIRVKEISLSPLSCPIIFVSQLPRTSVNDEVHHPRYVSANTGAIRFGSGFCASLRMTVGSL